jgi:5'(3')-deoxyribonucleotidase
MVIGIDCDGVLRDFTGKLIEVYKREFPKSKRPNNDNDIKQFDLALSFGIEKEIYDFAFVRHSKEIYSEANPYPGAAKFIQDIKKYDHKVVIVTSQPNQGCIDYTKFWLVNNDIQYDDLIFENNKEKAPVDILLDDYTKN